MIVAFRSAKVAIRRSFRGAKGDTFLTNVA